MILQLNYENNIPGKEMLENFASKKISHALRHFVPKITSIEVHLSDQINEKTGIVDIQCKLELRVEGMHPIIVVSQSNTKEKALDDAVNKIKATLDTVIGKMHRK